MSSSSRTGRISIRSSEPYTAVPATIVEDVPAGYDNGTILPAAFKTVNQPFYLTADPANLNVGDTLAVGGQIDLNGGVLTVAGGVLELDGIPVGGGGGGAVDSVSAGNGLVVAPTVGNVVVSMPNVGVAGTVNNVANIQTDAEGRVISRTSYGYVPVSPAVLTADLALKANLAGAVFTGPVDTTATTLTVAAPTANAQAATKLYVDNAVAGITPGGAVNTVVAGTNIAVDSTNAANPIVSVNITSALNMQTNEINNTGNISAPIGAQLDIKGGEINLIQSSTALGDPPAVGFPFPTVMNLNAAGGIALTGGGGIGINAGGVVEIAGGGTVQITSLGNISIGSGNVLGADTEIEHVAFKDNVISKYTTIAPGPNPDLVIQDVDTITMSGDLTTTADVNTKDLFATGDVIATGFVQAPRYIVGVAGAFTDIERNADGTLLTQLNGAGSIGGLVDTLINPALLSLAGTVLSIKAKDGTVSPATMSTVDLAPIIPAVPAGISKYATLSVAAGSTYTITAAQANSALWFDVAAAGNVNVLLPNGVPNGTQFFIGLPYDTAPGSQLTVFPVGGGVGGGRETIIKAANGGCLYIANGTVAGNVMYIPTDTGAYLALTGGTLTGALQVEETTNIEAKNITTALLTPLPSVGYISALGPMQVEGGNFLVANPAGSEIGLAASASPPLDQVATIKYNYTNDDLIHLNKVLEAPGAVLDGNDVVPLITFKDAKTFYVSKQGSDTNNGAANAPFLTVQAAITAALATGSEAVVSVGPGTFTETLTINSVAGIVIKGQLASDRCVEGTVLKGTIAVQCNTTDNMNNNQVVIADCFVQGHIHDTSTKQHTLIVNNCRIEANAANGGRAVQVAVSAADQRTFIQGCVCTQEAGTTGLSPMITANVGFLNIFECEMTVRADGCAVSVSGSALISRLSQCSLTSDSASASPNALLFLNSTAATPHAVSLNSFAYSSTTSKTTPAILATHPSPGVISCTLVENAFAIGGTLASGNVVQFTVGTTLVLLVANNRSLNTAAAPYASRIQSGATVLPLSQVGETTVNTVNSLSGALTLAAGTNVSLGTVGNTITINSTASGGGVVNSVVAGSGIAVNSSTPSAPVVSNTGVLSVAAGAGIAVSASTGDITISATGSASGATLYFNKSVPSDIPTYFDMSTTLLSAPETTLTATTSGGTPVLVGAFATPANYPNTTQIDAGIWNFNAYASVAAAANQSYIYGEIYKRSAAGTETLLGTSDNSVDINSITPTPVALTFNEAFAAATILTTDRVIVKFYYVHTGGSPETLTMYFEGTSHYTYVQTTINAIVVSGVQSVSAGTGISLTGTAVDPIVNNSGVLSLTAQGGLANVGTAADPIIQLSGTGTATFQDVAAVKLVASGTGADYSTFGALPRVSGTVPTPTEPSQLVPLQYVNSIDTGVQSVSAANASIDVGGSATAITLAVADSGVSGGTYTNATLTVGADGRLTAASSGDTGVLSVVAGSGIAVDSTIPSAPVVSNTGLLTASAGAGISLAGSTPGNVDIANTGVLSVAAANGSVVVEGTVQDPTIKLAEQIITPAAYAWPALTVNQQGVITSITENTVPFTELIGGSGISISSTPGSATITNDGVISLNSKGGSVSITGSGTVAIDNATPGVIDIQGTGVASVSGTAGQIVAGGTAVDPVLSLATAGTGEATHPYPASISVDDYGRVISITDGSAPTITTVNGNSGTVLLAAGTNMSIDNSVPGTITLNASGGGGGGIASINGQTGSAITLSGAGYVQVSNPTPDTIQFYTSGQVDQIQAGLGISVNNGDPVYPTITANVAGLQAGTGITVSPLANNVFQISASGGGAITLNSTTTPGLDITDDGNGNFYLANTGIISAAAGNTTMTVSNDGLGNLTLSASPGGSIVSDLNGGGTKNMTAMATVSAANMTGSSTVQASGGLMGFKATGGTSQTYSLVFADASSASEPGIKRCKLNQSNVAVAGTTGFMYDQYYNQTVAVPFATTLPSFVAPIGTTINNSSTKIVSQNIQPNGTAWNFLNARTWGILGNITLITAAAQPMRFTITYQKNGGTERTMAATYIQNNAYMTVPVNNISIGLPDNTLSANDTLTINVYAQTIVSLASTTIATAVPLIAAVLSPLSTNS